MILSPQVALPGLQALLFLGKTPISPNPLSPGFPPVPLVQSPVPHWDVPMWDQDLPKLKTHPRQPQAGLSSRGSFSLAGYPQCLSRCCFVTQHKLWVFRGRGSERSPRSAPAQLVILLWLLEPSFPAAREGSSINP